MKRKELLLVLPVPFLVKDNQLFFESQACNGLERWADNFGSVIVAAPTIPEALAIKNKSIVWQNINSLVQLERFELVPLPWAYSLPKFIVNYYTIKPHLKELIGRCHYLYFGIGGLWGDWASVAAIEARKLGREYVIQTDRVEHQVILATSKEASLLTQTKKKIIAFLMSKYHQLIIKNCTLGLWHGNDCYSAYSPFCKNNHLIHNIHLKRSDQITQEELTKKIQSVTTDPILRICYAGRMDSMKAPLDWVKAIAKAKELGVNLQAIWLGDGSLFETTKELIEQLKLNDCIQLVGFESNRQNLLETIKKSHLMLFTHITPESPRCLIESFVCGTPIVGYHSLYAEDLVQELGGGLLVPIHHWKELGELMATLSNNRQQLITLIQSAANNGLRFNDESLFQERSKFIKQYIKPFA